MMRRPLPSAVVALAALVLGQPVGAQNPRFERPSGVFAGRIPDAPLSHSRSEVDLRTSDAAPAPSTHNIRLSGDGRHLIVQGTFNRRLSGPMLVDTGASYCVLTRDSARRLGLAEGQTGTIPVATANGEIAADLIELESVQIENARVARVDALIMDAVDPPLIGIIGLSYLSHFRYSVDHAQGTIQLERLSRSPHG